MKHWRETNWEEKVIKICMIILWPTFVVWCIAALAKIILCFL